LLYDIYGEEKREIVPFDSISDNLKHSVLASEDSRFYQHGGVDFEGILRAAWVDLTSQSKSQGGSTLTQQLIRSVYLTGQKSIGRKIREIVLSIELDKKYSKDMIVFGFGFNEGKYTAVGNNGLGTYTTSSSQSGSLEWILHKTNKDQFIFDLRKAKDNPLFSFLKDDIEFRSIGALAMDDAFYKTKIMDEFDAIVYFDKTTPSACFGRPNKSK